MPHLYAYADVYAEERLEQELEQGKSSQLFQEVKNNEARLTLEIQKIKTSFREAVWQGVVSSAIFTAMLFLLGLTIRFAAPDSGVGKIIQFLAAPENSKIDTPNK